MMQTTPKLDAFEGLVHATARMFAAQVKVEEEDLRQELRVIVWKAVSSHHGGGSLEGYVFWCVTNKIKDYKRNAARRARYGIEFEYIEDQLGLSDSPTTEAFLGEHMSVEREHVYGRIEEGLLRLPATLTEREAKVLVLLMFDMSKPEIALRLGIATASITAIIYVLQSKLADWRPEPMNSRAVPLALAA